MAIDKLEADTFPKLLLAHARLRGERPAFREKKRGIWRTTTWQQLADDALALAAALSTLGLNRGDHVALIGDNRPRLYAAMCAIQCLGAVAVPLYQDAAAEEMVELVQRAEVTHVFAENQEQVDKLLEILPRCPTIRCIVYDNDRGMRHYRQPELVSYAGLLKQGRDLAATRREMLLAECARGKGDDAAFLFFTSGTTGPAKGVVLAHAALIDRAGVAVSVEGLTDADVAMAYLPPGWVGQNLFSYVQPMVAGYCVCCPESSDSMLADMREIGPTYFLATPRVLETLVTQVAMRLEDAGGLNRALYSGFMAVAQRVNARRIAGERVPFVDRLATLIGDVVMYGPLRDVLGMSRVRVAYTAGDAIAPEMIMFFRALGINLKQLYGSTETGLFVAMQRDDDVRPESVGKTADGVEIKFTSQREILVRSPGLFKEYHRDPQLIAQTKTADGWFHTGDAGYLDDDGHLRIIDRVANVGALSDGTALAPKAIENRLKFQSCIREAIAFGDGRDRVCALIDIDDAVVSRWADRRTISYTGHADLASRDEVYALVADCIGKVNADLARHPTLARLQIHRFAILPKEISADDGLLTRTGKLRRGLVAERFRMLVDAMYAGRTEVQVDGESADAGPATVKIRDARVSAAEAVRRAA